MVTKHFRSHWNDQILKCRSWPVPFRADKSLKTSYFLSKHLDTFTKVVRFNKCASSQSLKINSFHSVKLKLWKHWPLNVLILSLGAKSILLTSQAIFSINQINELSWLRKGFFCTSFLLTFNVKFGSDKQHQPEFKYIELEFQVLFLYLSPLSSATKSFFTELFLSSF